MFSQGDPVERKALPRTLLGNYTEEGNKKVMIKPKSLEYVDETLAVR